MHQQGRLLRLPEPQALEGLCRSHLFVAIVGASGGLVVGDLVHLVRVVEALAVPAGGDGAPALHTYTRAGKLNPWRASS